MRNIFIGIVMAFAIGTSTAYAENPDYLPGEVPILFVQKCKTCHGKDGRATKIGLKKGSPSDIFEAVSGKSVDEIEEIILNGVVKDGKKKMPAYKNKLTKEEIREIAESLMLFSKYTSR
jgi:mono/diheme cytochrome c family protein